jgi:hypothetical protein
MSTIKNAIESSCLKRAESKYYDLVKSLKISIANQSPSFYDRDFGGNRPQEPFAQLINHTDKTKTDVINAFYKIEMDKTEGIITELLKRITEGETNEQR